MGSLVGAIEERRAMHSNPTVVVGGGDEVSPSSLSPVSNWTVPVAVLNAIDPAAEVVGNHDLDYGFDAVASFANASSFPWLLSNVRDSSGEPVEGTENYTIVERDGVRIGVVGLVDGAIDPKTAVDFDEAGYNIESFTERGDTIARQLKTQNDVDVVIGAAHIGVPESKELARSSEHIDVIVTGDDEIEYAPQETSGTVIMEAEARGEHLAEVNLTVGANGSVSMQDGQLLDVGGPTAPMNDSVRQLVADARSRQLDETIGTTTGRLDSTFTANYHDETAWGNLITDAFRNRTGADVAVTNAGGIRGDFVMEPGPITYDDVYTSLPFGNTLVTKELTGAELRSLLESQLVTLDSPDGERYGQEPSLQVSGVRYEYLAHANVSNRIRDVTVGGEPIDPDATYTVTVNSYMAGWDDLSTQPTVSHDYTLYGTAVAEYIASRGTIDPPSEDRIRRVDREIAPGQQRGAPRGTVPLQFSVPENVTAVNESTARIQNRTSGDISAERVQLANDRLLVFVDGEAYRSLASNSASLQLYVEYTDRTYDSELVYFENSVLNSEVRGWNETASSVSNGKSAG